MYKVSSTSSLFLNLFNDSLSAIELAYISDQMACYIVSTSILSADLVNVN
jgi:hypothetical protein